MVPAYAGDPGRNPGAPSAARPSAWSARPRAIAGSDRSWRPIPDVVQEVPITGDNPDVDTQADLARAVEAAWAARVRANREQVERVREVPDGADFYAPVRSLFRADPTRTDDPILDVLLDLVRSGDRWLDVGAGAGRFALPLARALDPSGGSVVALDASPSMLEGLREIAEDYAIENVRAVEARWPPADAGAFDSGRRADRARRLRHRGDRCLHRRPGGDRATPVRGRPDGAATRRRRRPVLAGRPR